MNTNKQIYRFRFLWKIFEKHNILDMLDFQNRKLDKKKQWKTIFVIVLQIFMKL